MKIFLTGFDGYVGSHVVTALHARRAAITALCRDAAAEAKALAAGLAVARGSIDDTAWLADIVSSHDAVAHFAASDRPEFLPVNRAAIDAMVAALPKDGAFLMHGGSLVFGEQGRDTPAVKPAFNPPPPLAGRAALDRHVLTESPATTRIYVVYGAFVFGGRGAMIPNAMLAAAAQSDTSGYPGSGEAIWSAVHVADWADLMARALFDGPRGHHTVLAAAQDIRIKDAAAAIGSAQIPPKAARAIDVEEARKRYPFFADALTLYQRFAPEPAHELFGWTPSRLDFAASLQERAGSRP